MDFDVNFQVIVIIEKHAHTTNNIGIGDIDFKFTSSKSLTLKYIMHNIEIRNNIVSRFLLNKVGLTYATRRFVYHY